MGTWMRATMGWFVVGMRVGAAWTEDGAEAVVMGDRDGGEDVQVKGVKVGVASLGMGMQVRGRGDGDGFGQTAGGAQAGSPSLDPSPADATRSAAREPCAAAAGAAAAAPAAAFQAAVAVTLRAARDSRCGRVGAWGPGRGKAEEQDRAGGLGGGAGGQEPGRSCGHRCPGSPATALARTARAAAPGAGTRLLPQPPPRRARHRPVSQEPAGRLPAPPAAGGPLAPCGPAPPGCCSQFRAGGPLQHSRCGPGARCSGARAHPRGWEGQVSPGDGAWQLKTWEPPSPAEDDQIPTAAWVLEATNSYPTSPT